MENTPLARIRSLLCMLLASGALNIILLSFLFYWIYRDRPPAPYFELKPATPKEQQAPLANDKNNAELIRTLKNLPMNQLVGKLSDTQLVENGYKQRDLALGCLITFHYFDLERALLGMQQPEQQRGIIYGKRANGTPCEVVVYPSLTDQQFASIIQFAHKERWPQTAKGQYLLLKKQAPSFDASLMDAFFLTREFLSVEMLFNRGDIKPDKQEIVKLLCEGDWPCLTAFAEQQRKSQDLSPARRQRFLLDYIEKKSKAAAQLMVKTEGAFASKKLDDHHTLAILKLLTEKTPYSEQFALALLTSPRSDLIWGHAAARLYEYAGESPPQTINHRSAVSKFLPKTASETKIIAPVSLENKNLGGQQAKLYVVQEGDSLWKIAKKYKVDMEALKKQNKLESDFLKPGITLKIP